MKTRISRIVGVLLFVALLIGCLGKASDILERKDSQYKYRDFYEQKEDFDVLFIGTSHVINGIFPMEMWRDYGIVSYNMGGHGNQMATNYWVLRNTLEYTTPQLVVIDILEIDKNDKVALSEDQSRLSLDSMPFSKVKLEAIRDLFGDKALLGTEREDLYQKRWEFLFDFGKYHSRWNDLSKEDFDKEYASLEKGAETRVRVDVPIDYYIVPREYQLTEDTVAEEYLKKMIEECQARGIQVVLTHVPYPAGEWSQLAGNMAYDIADEYGVEYLNFVAMDNVVDYQTDCYDSRGHLNASGGKKVSRYLGQYLQTHYQIPDRRGDERYAHWETDYQKYYEEKRSRLQDEEDVYCALMLLQDNDFDVMIYIDDDATIAKEEKLYRLIGNMIGKEVVLPEAGEYTDLFAVVSREQGKCDYVYGRTNEDEPSLVFETNFGTVTYKNGMDGEKTLTLNGEEENLLLGYQDRYGEEETPIEPDVSIWVYDSKTGERLFRKFWNGVDGPKLLELK